MVTIHKKNQSRLIKVFHRSNLEGRARARAAKFKPMSSIRDRLIARVGRPADLLIPLSTGPVDDVAEVVAILPILRRRGENVGLAVHELKEEGSFVVLRIHDGNALSGAGLYDLTSEVVELGVLGRSLGTSL